MGSTDEYGQRNVVKMHQPTPTRAETEEHAITHLPFRSWCEHCVKGQGEEMRHLKVKEKPEQRELHLDFCLRGEGTNDKKLMVLVVRGRRARLTISTRVPSKSNGEFLAKRALAFMREIGAGKGDIMAKTDEDPATKVVLNEIARHRAAAGGGRLVQEHSPVGP